ncbi:MAG: hypothetical protein P8X58_08735, partial [Syntrophobacterales bacterium]
LNSDDSPNLVEKSTTSWSQPFKVTNLLIRVLVRGLFRHPPERLAVVTASSQADVNRLDLHRQGLADVRLWLEPKGKNTAPAVGLAARLP